MRGYNYKLLVLLLSTIIFGVSCHQHSDERGTENIRARVIQCKHYDNIARPGENFTLHYVVEIINISNHKVITLHDGLNSIGVYSLETKLKQDSLLLGHDPIVLAPKKTITINFLTRKKLGKITDSENNIYRSHYLKYVSRTSLEKKDSISGNVINEFEIHFENGVKCE